MSAVTIRRSRTRQRSRSNSTSTQDSSTESYVMDIEDNIEKITTYFNELLDLSLQDNKIGLQIRTLNSKLLRIRDNPFIQALPVNRQIIAERNIERTKGKLEQKINTLRRERREFYQKINILNRKIEEKANEIKNEIRNLQNVDNVNKFKIIKVNLEKSSRLQSTTKVHRTVMNKMHIDRIEEDIESVKTDLHNLLEEYKSKTTEFIDIKILYHNEKIKLKIFTKNANDRSHRALYQTNNEDDESLRHLEESVKTINGEFELIESEITEIEREIKNALNKEHKLMEDYRSITMGGSIKNKYKVKKNSRKTMKRSSRV